MFMVGQMIFLTNVSALYENTTYFLAENIFNFFGISISESEKSCFLLYAICKNRINEIWQRSKNKNLIGSYILS